jgi:hypothetical protein
MLYVSYVVVPMSFTAAYAVAMTMIMMAIAVIKFPLM